MVCFEHIYLDLDLQPQCIIALTMLVMMFGGKLLRIKSTEIYFSPPVLPSMFKSWQRLVYFFSM